MNTGESKTFTATVSNTTNTTVVWTVQESGGGTVNGGLYTAPNTAGTFHVIATSQADTTKKALAEVTVLQPGPKITSTAPQQANEDDAYTYNIVADGKGAPVTLTLTAGPANATISGTTLTWTPTRAQSRKANQFTIEAKNSGGTDTQSFTVSPSGTVRGTAIVTYYNDKGKQDKPVDLSIWQIEAYIRQAGELAPLDVVKRSGAFEIARVPAGSYWLRVSGVWFWMSASEVDFGRAELFRSDLPYASVGTYLDLSLSGLRPWSRTSGSLNISSPNLSGSLYFDAFKIPDQATEFVNKAEWTDQFADGDDFYALQFGANDVDGIRSSSIVKASSPIPVTMLDGGTVPFSAVMQDPPINGSVRVNLRGSDFAELGLKGSDAHPTALLTVSSQPFESDGPHPFASPLDLYDNQGLKLVQNVDLGDFPVPDPFPSTWTRFVRYEYDTHRSYIHEGNVTYGAMASIAVTTKDLPAADNPLTPLIGPVRDVTIDAMNASEPQTIITKAPLIKWSPPSVGTPTGYQIDVVSITPSASSPFQWVLRVCTSSTSVVLPSLASPVFTQGTKYTFKITAFYTPGADLSVAPYRKSWPTARADYLSGLITGGSVLPLGTTATTNPAPAPGAAPNGDGSGYGAPPSSNDVLGIVSRTERF